MAKKPASKPPEQKKGIVEKIVDAVDHVIHPDQAPAIDQEHVSTIAAEVSAESAGEEAKDPAPAGSYREHMAQWESKKEAAAKKPAESSQEAHDLQSHPKFDKFKTGRKSP